MKVRSFLSRPFAKRIVNEQNRWAANPGKAQDKILTNLIKQGTRTKFGEDHSFSQLNDYTSFKDAVPIRDYEDLKLYVDRILKGDRDVLWPGKPIYLAKTSGTTSGTKYIPITKDSIPNHINSARNALLTYIFNSKNAAFVDRKLIFLSGSPTLELKAGINTGRLSGIVNHHVPSYLRSNQLPSFETNCIEDWEDKLERIIDETLNQDMSLISGIPPWVQMYFDRIQERTGKLIKDVFPNFELFVYGGVNFEPYKARLIESIGREIDSIETYPASEGFIAYQDTLDEEGLLLLLDSGIFFEFIPSEEYFSDTPTRLTIEEVELGKNYAVILNSNAGLWGYSIGDTVKFVSLDPFRVVVTGRIKHFISAFGEHVIGEEVEKALKLTIDKFSDVEVTEFTVAPQVNPTDGLPHHEWYFEFAKEPSDLASFQKELDLQLRHLNSYYDDLLQGNILKELEVIQLKQDGFRDYMKSQGKLGGQNKVPRLSNDRKIADDLESFTDSL